MAEIEQQGVSLQGTVQCSELDGRLMDSTRIDTILSANKICQGNFGQRPELSDGSSTVKCHKNRINKYVSPSALQKLSKHVPSDDASDGATVSLKCLRSSVGSTVFDFCKHCLFCYDVSPCIAFAQFHFALLCLLCTLPHEYDGSVP